VEKMMEKMGKNYFLNDKKIFKKKPTLAPLSAWLIFLKNYFS